jgi:hypothetical protein
LNIKNWGGVSSRVAYSRSCTSHFWVRPTFSLYIARQTHLYFIDRFISLLFSTFKVFSESTLSADDYWYTTQGSCWSANPNYKYGSLIRDKLEAERSSSGTEKKNLQ